MLDETLNFIGDVEIFVAGSGAIVFAVSYAAFFNWRKTQAGRALMWFVLSLVALFVLNALGRWTGSQYPFREYIRFGVYSTLVVTIWHLVWVLWRGWRSGAVRPLEIETKTRNKETGIMSSFTPSETPNVVVSDPRVRKVVGNTLAIASVALAIATLVDGAITEIAYGNMTGPAAVIIGGLFGIFQVVVTSPNVPKA